MNRIGGGSGPIGAGVETPPCEREPPQERSRCVKRGAWQAGLGVLALGLMTTRGLVLGDAAIHFAAATSIVERGEMALRMDPGDLWVPSAPRAGGLLYQDGEELRSASAPGLALLAVPLVAAPCALRDDPPVRSLIAPFFVASEVGRDASVPLWIRYLQLDPRVIAFSLLGPLSAALTAAFLWLAACARGLTRPARWGATFALALGSPMLAYAGTSWTQLPTSAAIAFALWRTVDLRAVTLRREPPAVGHRRTVLSEWVTGPLPVGLALSIAVFVRPDHVIFGVPFAAAWVHRERALAHRGASLGAAGILIPPVVTSCTLTFAGVPLTGDGWSAARIMEGVLGLLVSPRTGLVVFAPFVPFAVWGLWCSRSRACPMPGEKERSSHSSSDGWPRDRSGARLIRSSAGDAAVLDGAVTWVVLGGLAMALALYGGWFDWPGSLAYGPRFLLPLLAPLALGFGIALEGWTSAARWAAWGSIPLGLLIQLPGALLMHSRIPEADAFTDPTVVGAWRALLAGGGASFEVDCVSRFEVAYPVLTLAVAFLGLTVSARRCRSAIKTRAEV